MTEEVALCLGENPYRGIEFRSKHPQQEANKYFELYLGDRDLMPLVSSGTLSLSLSLSLHPSQVCVCVCVDLKIFLMIWMKEPAFPIKEKNTVTSHCCQQSIFCEILVIQQILTL